jgi:hypothetical protein
MLPRFDRRRAVRALTGAAPVTGLTAGVQSTKAPKHQSTIVLRETIG